MIEDQAIRNVWINLPNQNINN